jgi:hypothetical protein
MTYHQGFPRETYCDACGELVTCSIFVADYPDRETGYVDSRALCSQCEEEEQ